MLQTDELTKVTASGGSGGGGRDQYRAGDWEAARASLLKCQQLGPIGQPDVDYFMAMILWRIGDKDQARSSLDRGDQWIKDNRNGVARYWIQLTRAEAAALLGVREDPKLGLRLPPRLPATQR